MKVKKKKKSRLAVVFLCVAAVFALLWGGAELLRHLTHYGENATVGTQEQPGQPDEPAENTQTQENGLIDGLPANPHNEEDFAQKGGFTLLRVRLLTGRPHQIRVQFASRQLPLLGDIRYGCKDPLCDVALWSYRLGLRHPKTGQALAFCQPPPAAYPWSLFAGTITPDLPPLA